MNQLLERHPEEINEVLAKYPPEFKRSALMPLLHLAQREQGYIGREALEEVAEISGVTATEAASIVGFYSLFYDAPGGRYRIQVCTDLPCALRGAETFFQELCARLDIEPGGTTADGLFTVEAVKCLAACHQAPMFQVQGEGMLAYHERQTLEDALGWISEVKAREMAQKEERQ